MSGLGKRLSAVAAAGVAALALSAPLAGADGGAKSKITIKKLSATGAAGKVSSGRASCIKDRKVSLFIYENFVTDKLDITHTNSKGSWRIKRDLKEGVYFAKVDATKGCRYDNSKRERLTIG